MSKYPMLMSPLRIGRFVLKNRIEAAPAGMSNLTPEAYFTQSNYDILEERAKGGAAIVNMGEARIDLKTGISHKLTLALDDPEILPYLHEATDIIKRYGAIPGIELLHPGGRTNPEYYDGTIWAPSDAPGHLGKPYTALDEDTINYIVECFGNAAEMAMLGGVQLITIHGGHGWLIHEFLSPKNNRRTDKFGGSLENRARFLNMVLDKVREKCGDNIILELRLSGTEFVEGGLTIEDQCEVARMVDDKVDIFNVSTGSFHFPETNQLMDPNMFRPHGCNVKYAAAIKKVVRHAKVMGIGGINDPAQMEEFLKTGQCDLIGMVRALIADPELPEKIKSGREDDITPCQRCNACLSESFVPYVKYCSRIIRCTANPNFFREKMLKELKPAVCRKKVLVAGGGPAGMTAAITLADRGHEVILCEKSGELGGAMKYAKNISFKQDMDKLMNVLIRRVTERPIRVMLNTEVTPEFVKAQEVDAVICAIGARPVIPDIKGINSPNVVIATDVHDKMDEVGENVVILGGGLVGCEESIDLAMKGRNVTVLEMKSGFCMDAPYLHHEAVILEMEAKGVKGFLNTKAVEITTEGVNTVADGETGFFPCDTVIVAAGMKALTEEVDALCSCVEDIKIAGDCNFPRKLHEAMREGFNAAAFLC